jgi:proteasome lid subunit RPN8/RPN11
MAEEKKKVGSGKKDNTNVIIKPQAYAKMKAHVLRFGSNVRDRSEYREVMGMLMGRLVDGKNPNIKDVIVEDAVPVNHGGKVEVAFAPDDYVNFSILDSAFADRGMFNVGWYHSHPGLSCFFSSVDIRNQLGFQAANPAAIGIVFDHERFKDEDDLGFDCYRLDDPSQGPMSDYHEVNWILEAPEDHSFYTEIIKNLIDAYHRGEPPILELSEVPDVFGDLSMPGRNAMMAKEPELNFADFSEKLAKGVGEFASAFFQPLYKFLNGWAGAMSKGLIEKNIEILEILNEVKNNISTEVAQLQSWFKFQLNDQLRSVDILIDDQLENLKNQQGQIEEKITGIEKVIREKLSSAFTEALGKTISSLTGQIDDLIKKLKSTEEQSSPIVSKVTKQNELLTQGISQFTQQVEGLKKAAGSMASSLEMTVNTSIGGVSNDLDKIVEQQRDFIDSLKALKNMVGGL